MSEHAPKYAWPGPDLPPMARVAQSFDDSEITDAGGAAERAAAEALRGGTPLRPGASVAVTVGSRGIDRIAEVVAGTVRALRAAGAEPFIVPAMGSHGGGTAEGQAGVLAGYGVTESAMGAPIRSGMETVTPTEVDGTTLHTDALAAAADAIVVVNRVKPHTNFTGDLGSGLIKMLTIGLGNQRGAASVHARGFADFAAFLPRAARALLAELPVVFGVAVVENAFDRICTVEGIVAAQWHDREPQLFQEAHDRMGSLLLDGLHVLVIDELGKNVSGAGMDPNITGRPGAGLTGFPPPPAERIVVLGLTEATHGNATGIGLADVITRSCFDGLDFDAMYLNGVTSRTPEGVRIPIVAADGAAAVRLGIDTSSCTDPGTARIVRIRDTLHLSQIEVSPACLDDVAGHERLELLSDPAPASW